MTAPEPNRHIVRPFGLIGGRYEVDNAGLQKYRIGWAIALAFIAIVIFRDALGLPLWLYIAAAFVVLTATLGLCADIVRKGRKL